MADFQKQDKHLIDDFIRQKRRVCLYLNNGKRLTGVIIAHTQSSLLVRSELTQIILKKTIQFIK